MGTPSSEPLSPVVIELDTVAQPTLSASEVSGSEEERPMERAAARKSSGQKTVRSPAPRDSSATSAAAHPQPRKPAATKRALEMKLE